MPLRRASLTPGVVARVRRKDSVLVTEHIILAVASSTFLRHAARMPIPQSQLAHRIREEVDVQHAGNTVLWRKLVATSRVPHGDHTPSPQPGHTSSRGGVRDFVFTTYMSGFKHGQVHGSVYLSI
jgi:hypothetical protein